jgi:hypothetical protein
MAVLAYLQFAGDRYMVLKGPKTKEKCFYCMNLDGLIDPNEFDYH